MSSLIVEATKIDAIRPHPNADSLELCDIKGWQCIVPKGKYSAGELVVYVLIDSVLPAELSDKLGVTKYLSNGRVRCAKLRGEPSFGLVFSAEAGMAPGNDVAAIYGITKYQPPLKVCAGDAEVEHPLFPSYHSIENMRNFPDVFKPGERVIATEKIHGTNCRVGIVNGELMAGSMRQRRKPPKDGGPKSIYWHPHTIPAVSRMMEYLALRYRQVIVYGEIFGPRVQNLSYGVAVGKLGFRVFDIFLDGRFLGWQDFEYLTTEFKVPTPTRLLNGLFDLNFIRFLSGGNTSITLDTVHIREGVVVRSLMERTDPRIGRVILKYISDEYLLSKNISDVAEA